MGRLVVAVAAGVCFFTLNVSALEFSVIGPCDPKPILKTQAPSQETTLGDLTLEVLKANQMPFQGDRSGIKMIAGSPMGDDALEVLSDSLMRAYGWCVLVDGRQPDRMPDEVPLNLATKEITWFYAFALYDRGEWKSFCTPSHQVQPSQVCPAKAE